MNNLDQIYTLKIHAGLNILDSNPKQMDLSPMC